MIHRAILGSVERFMAILTEHTGGKWPLWLSPRQVAILPVSPASDSHLTLCRGAEKLLHSAGVHVEVDASADTLGKRIRRAQLLQFNYIAVVGDREAADGTLTIRTRDDNNVREVAMPPADLLQEIQSICASQRTGHVAAQQQQQEQEPPL